MILFWVIVFFMTLVALAILLLPMLRAQTETGPERTDINISIYRKQLDSLQSDLNDGVIDQKGFDTSKQELDQNLLADTATEDAKQIKSSGRVPAAIIAVLIPLIAVGLYVRLGSTELIDPSATTSVDPNQAAQMQSIDKMVRGLEERLQKDPNDSEGWIMLGRSYTALRRFGDAEQAYGKAYTLIGDVPDFLADYAEILAMNANNQLQGPPTRLLQSALKKDPKNIKSLWLSGHAALQLGDKKKAVAYWKKLLSLLPKNDEAVATVQQYIAQVEGQPAPKATSKSVALTVSVRLDPAIRSKVRPDQAVFIYARAAQGPRMPLAIARKQVKDLPLTVILDDSMAMTPQMKLSKFEQVVVGARVSMTGNALSQSGDIQGLSKAILNSRKQPVSIVIDSVVP